MVRWVDFVWRHYIRNSREMPDWCPYHGCFDFPLTGQEQPFSIQAQHKPRKHTPETSAFIRCYWQRRTEVSEDE
ncbi:hypothetical protein GN956_G21208 [Arapaima gigas]